MSETNTTSNLDPSGYDLPFVGEFYDHVVLYRERQDVQFFVDEAVACGGDVLEVACGTGRVLIPTARAGVNITGIDLSEGMLRKCRESLELESDDVRRRVSLSIADMRDFDLGRTFDLITLPFRPFQHLVTLEDQRSCLAAVRRHLKPGGRMILDIFNPSFALLAIGPTDKPFSPEPEFVLPDGRRVIRTGRISAMDYANQINTGELIYLVTHPDGREETLVHPFQMRYLFRFEAEHLLTLCGFEVERVYGDYDRSPFGTKVPGEIIIVAKRNS